MTPPAPPPSHAPAPDPFGCEGRCRGALLRDWQGPILRADGELAVQRVREYLGDWSASLPDEIDAGSWWPVGVQLAITQGCIDVVLGGQGGRLGPFLASDLRQTTSRARRYVAAKLGPARIVRQLARAYPHAYDFGHIEVQAGFGADAGAQGATFHFAGSTTFAHPTWLPLQLAGLHAIVELTDRRVESVRAEATGDDSASVAIAWQ